MIMKKSVLVRFKHAISSCTSAQAAIETNVGGFM